jgi:hypothetical protein
LDAAKQERQRAEQARRETAEAEGRQKQEARWREKAERKAKAAKERESLTKSRYKALFFGIAVFTVALAVLMAYDRRSVFKECGRWFTDRAENLISIFRWLVSSFAGFATSLSGTVPSLPTALCYIISAIIFTAIAAGLYFGLKWAIERARGKIQAVKRAYADGLFKAVLTVSASVSLFYVCLSLHEQIKGIVPLNIFSVWLLLSLIAAATINFKEISKGLTAY